jgi:hypothetical protein
MIENNWILPTQDKQEQKNALCEQLQIPPVIAHLLVSRGIETFEEAKEKKKRAKTKGLENFIDAEQLPPAEEGL